MLTWQNTGDPCAPETLTFVNHLMPTRIGYTTALGPYAFTSNNTEITMAVNTGYSPRGLSYFDSTGAQQFIFTLSNKIFRYPNNADISRGVAYTNGYFSFAQYRDKIYAVNGADLLQKSTTGAFADVASTPKLTRIAVNGEYMAGINLVANYTLASAAVVAASAYRLMISAVGNPEQFDYSVDTTAFTQDIVNTGGPLTALATLRDMFVVFQKSGVYVVESTGNPADPWAIRLVSDYYGCEWPDSVIEVNNVLYWISPTRSGEVCAFDGSQITVLSQALNSTIVDYSAYYSTSGFVGSLPIELEGGLTAATDGETIVWNRLIADTFSGSVAVITSTRQLYLNIPTGRFGYSNSLSGTTSLFGVFSNAWQNGILSVIATQLSAGANKFKAAYAAQDSAGTVAGTIDLYRRADSTVKITDAVLSFSEYVRFQGTATDPTLGNVVARSLSRFTASLTLSQDATRTPTPTFKWSSTKRTGDSLNKPEGATPVSVPAATWNSDTHAFNISAASTRSQAAKTFAISFTVAPINSLVGLKINYAPAGDNQAGAKAGAWQ